MPKITIQGESFEVPSPYEPGHVCTAAEAEMLNQKFRERIRAKFSQRVKDFWEKVPGWHQKLQEELDEISASYSLNGLDPVHVEAFCIAISIVKTNLRAAGKNVSDYARSALTTMAEEVLAGPQRGEITLMARERVVALQKAAKAELERKDAHNR